MLVGESYLEEVRKWVRRTSRSSGNCNGLYKISAAPALSARSACSSTLKSVVHPLFKTTGILRVDIFLFNCTVTSSPFNPGKRMSIMIRSGRRLKALSRPSGPVAASTTSWPKPLKNPRSDSRNFSLPSTIKYFFSRVVHGRSVAAQDMPALQMSVFWYFVAFSAYAAMFGAAICLENDCHFAKIRWPCPLSLCVEGVEKVNLGYIRWGNGVGMQRTHPSTEVTSTRWRDTSRTT